MNIAVLCPNLVGDAVMATPTFRALKNGFPTARLIAVIRPSLLPVLEGTPWFDQVIAYNPRSKSRAERTPAIAWRLRSERCQLAVFMPNSFRVAWLAFLAGIPRRVGYERYGRGLLLTDRLQEPRDQAGRRLPTPIVGTYLELARRLGCPVDSAKLELATTPDDEFAADRAYRELGLSLDQPVVCLNTGGAYGPAKSWPEEHFAELARRLVDERGASVLVLCGPAERSAARGIVARAGRSRVVCLADQPVSLGLTKACVRRSALLVTTDSGPRHFAAAFDTPVLTLFGPTHIAWTRTQHPRAWHMLHSVPCGPCQRPTCLEGHHRCLRDLTPDRVFLAAARLLEMGSFNRLGRGQAGFGVV